MTFYKGNRVKVVGNTRIGHYAPIGSTGIVEADTGDRGAKNYRVRFDPPVPHVGTEVDISKQVIAEEDLAPARTIEEMRQEFLKLIGVEE